MTLCSWHPHKREANLRKHGIDFLAACRIFDGPTVEFDDDHRDYGERRIGAFGEADGLVMFVVYTWRAGRRRLISARKAGRDEREAYRNAIQDA